MKVLKYLFICLFSVLFVLSVIGLTLLFIPDAVNSLSLGKYFPSLLVGAVITGNFLGNMSKTLGKKVVFFRSFGKNLAREYVIPRYTNTTEQVAQRTYFSQMVNFAKAFLYTVIHGYWEQWAIGYSGWIAFMKANYAIMGESFSLSKALIAVGPITPEAITACNLNAQANYVTFTWDTELKGNQLATDQILMVVYDTDTNSTFVNLNPVLRSAGTGQVPNITQNDQSKLHGFIFAIRDYGTSSQMISNSTYRLVGSGT